MSCIYLPSGVKLINYRVFCLCTISAVQLICENMFNACIYANNKGADQHVSLTDGSTSRRVELVISSISSIQIFQITIDNALKNR